MFIKKTISEIMKSAYEKLSTNASITNFHSGSIARSIVDSLAGEYEDLYEFAEDVLNQGYVSKAEGKYLEMIGELFNLERRIEQVRNEKGELEERPISDDTYRYEISKQVMIHASSNAEAVRFAILSTPGIRSVHTREFSHGSGSFTYVIVPMQGFDEETVQETAQDNANRSKAFGVKCVILLPIQVDVDMKIRLMVRDDVAIGDKESIAFNVRNAIYDYVGNLALGETFVYYELVERIMKTDERILDFQVESLVIGNVPALLGNFEIGEEETFKPNNIEIYC